MYRHIQGRLTDCMYRYTILFRCEDVLYITANSVSVQNLELPSVAKEMVMSFSTQGSPWQDGMSESDYQYALRKQQREEAAERKKEAARQARLDRLREAELQQRERNVGLRK